MAYVKHEDLCGAFKGKCFMGFFLYFFFSLSIHRCFLLT